MLRGENIFPKNMISRGPVYIIYVKADSTVKNREYAFVKTFESVFDEDTFFNSCLLATGASSRNLGAIFLAILVRPNGKIHFTVFEGIILTNSPRSRRSRSPLERLPVRFRRFNRNFANAAPLFEVPRRAKNKRAWHGPIDLRRQGL